MENAEEVLQSLDEFAKLKPKDIPRELEEYLSYVAKTGDPVYQWSIVKCLFREKLLNVITEFYETSPTIDLPPCPNVDPFNYETMKNSLLERLDSFPSAPFTVQRLCELLTTPRKEYSRADKFMRAIEKNILVVSTREPGNVRRTDNNGQPELLMNGVMDGRGIELGEAIETVSSDGVNLMHSDENEVNVTENENMPVECSGMEDVDMEDQSENSNACNSSSWEKEPADTSRQNEERDKSSSEEVSNKGEAPERVVAEKSNEGSVADKAARSEDSSAATDEVKTPDVSKENCKETASELLDAKSVEHVDTSSATEQELESQDSSCKESSNKADEKESNADTEETVVASVEETSPKKIMSQQESSVTDVDSKDSEEVPSPDSSCSLVEKDSEASIAVEAESKPSSSPAETSVTIDIKDEATIEVSAASPTTNTTTEQSEEMDKQIVSAETNATENRTLENQVSKSKDDDKDDDDGDEAAAANCTSPQKQEAELTKHADSKDEESEVTEDLKVKEVTVPVSEQQTEIVEQEQAMEVEINAAPPTAEETQHCDEPMDQTEQPNEGPEEEGKS